MKTLALLGFLSSAYSTREWIHWCQYFVALDNVGKLQLGSRAVFILGTYSVNFWLLLR